MVTHLKKVYTNFFSALRALLFSLIPLPLLLLLPTMPHRGE
jgi:hypothetical protein